MVAICGEQLSRLALVPTSTVGGAASNLTEMDIPGSVGAPNGNRGGAGGSVEAISQAVPSSLRSVIPL